MAIPAPSLGSVIRQRRAELGWSQEELAARVSELGGELRQSDISRLELGKVGLPRRERLTHLAEALGLPVGELLLRSGWAGADHWDAAERTTPNLVAPVAVEPPRATAVGSPRLAPPDPDPVTVDRCVWRDRRLGEVIVEAERTRARTAQILQRSQAIWDLANQAPRGRAAGAPEA
jgi:transcriptional regulator with XRE-family HTH domain